MDTAVPSRCLVRGLFDAITTRQACSVPHTVQLGRVASTDTVGMEAREDAWSESRPDRRVNRFDVPPCRRCSSPYVFVSGRTVDTLLLTCQSCEERWLVPKPTAGL
jgi:hypothetical protein